MVYPIDPANPTYPRDIDQAQYGAAELRALKAYIASLQFPGAAGTNLFRKNLIVNGDFFFDQRQEGTATVLTGAVQYVADKFVGYKAAAATASATAKVAGIGLGSVYALQCATTVAGAPIAADIAGFETAIEGFDAAFLQWGTATALPVSISFLVKSPVVGLHSVALRNAAKTRSYVATFNILNANTVQVVQLSNIVGCTDGVWATDNTLGIDLFIDLGSGSNFETANANSWQVGNFTRTAGTVKVQNNIGTFAITNIQVEQATSASVFEQQPYTVKLANCQRYYEKSFSPGIKPAQGVATGAIIQQLVGLTIGRIYYPFKVQKRIVPTAVLFNPSAVNSQMRDQTTGTDFSASSIQVNENAAFLFGTPPGGAANGDNISGQFTATADFF